MKTLQRRPLILSAATGLALGLAVAAVAAPATALAVGTLSPGEVALQLHDQNHARNNYRIGTPLHLAVSFPDADGPQLPTGTVQLQYFANGSCTGTPAKSSTATMVAGVTDPVGDAYTPNLVGQICIKWNYSGDALYGARSGSLSTAILKAVPSIEIQVHNSAHQPKEVLPTSAQAHVYTRVSGNAGVASGEIAIASFLTGNCSGNASFAFFQLSSGQFDGYQISVPGPRVMSFRVDYAGSAAYEARSSGCASMTWKATPAIEAVVHDAAHQVVTEIALYGRVHVRAEVAGAFGTPTGSVRTSLWENATCSGSPNIFTTSLLADGVTDTAGVLAFSRLGQMSVRVDYIGSETYFGTPGPCLSVTVKATPTILIEAFDGLSAVTTLADGQAFRYRTRLLGTFGIVPTKPLTIHAYAEAACQGPATTAQVTVGGGTDWYAGPAMIAVGPGMMSARATYSGDATYLQAESACLEVTVTAAAPTAAPSQGTSAPPTADPTAPTTPDASDASASTPATGAPEQASPPPAGATFDPGSQPSSPSLGGPPSAAPPSGAGESAPPSGASANPAGTMEPAGPGAPVGSAAGSSPGDGAGVVVVAGIAAAVLLALAFVLLLARRRSAGLRPGQG